MAIDYFFVDERGCIWWWDSWLFLYYLYQNLPYLAGINKEAALAEILAAFLCFGYFRVGMVTFHDPMGIGSPSHTLSISATSGGTTDPSPGTYTYGSGSSVIVTATAYSPCYLNHWVLDGATVYGNPITITMNSDHTLKAYFSERGSSCPYVYTWDGKQYVMDNNLLPASEMSDGADVEDYYRLEQTLVPMRQGTASSLYSLQIREFENEHDYLDQVKLLAVDHESDVNIAVTQQGEILTYTNPSPPLSCLDNNGTSKLSEISKMDGDISDPATYFEGYPGDYLILNFGRIASDNTKLILRTDMKKEFECIEVQVRNSSGMWQTVEVLVPRNYWSMEAVNLSPYVNKNEDLMVRLFWKYHHRLDYVGLDTTSQDSFELHYATLISAIHSSEGNVKRRLLENDQTYAELTPRQQIQLTFQLPNNQNQKRTFIFYTEGHYNTIEI